MDSEIEVPPTIGWRESRKQQLREALVSTALRIFEERGFDASSVDEIAASVGIAKGTFYLYFKTKADIVQAVLDLCADRLDERMSSAVSSAPEDASEALKTLARTHLSFLSEHSAVMELLIGNREAACSCVMPQAAEGFQTRYRAATAALYERLIRKGMLQQCYREVDARFAARALCWTITGSVWDTGGADTLTPDPAAEIVSLFDRGLRGKP